jgi:hypothetical protein
MSIKKGDCVEFTRKYYQSYPPADKSVVLFGIAIENEGADGEVKVETAKGIEIAKYIYAYAWMGWIPEDLEAIYEKHNPPGPEDYDKNFEEGY